ncbi:MAG: hypothetical protein GX445_01495 [Elusimicrobia bacterium]|nr:hypothetical protein [Elusimicrobiota bacterium]
MKKIFNMAFMVQFLFLSINTIAVEPDKSKTKNIVVDMYFEPFDAKAWQNYLNFDLIRRKNRSVKLNPYPIIMKDKNNWISSHGEIEVKEVARIEGIIKKYPSKLNDYMIARSLYMSVEGWKDALLYAQINPLEFENYINQNKNMLLNEAYSRLDKNKISSMSVFINGSPYKGSNGISEAMATINSLLPAGERFNLYSDEFAKFKKPKFIVLSDSNTKDWINPNVEMIFKRFFTSMDVSTADISGIDISDKSKIKMLPAYMLEKNDLVDEALAGAIAQNVFDVIDNYYVYYDQNSRAILNGKKKEPNKLELFVMSHCPFGVMAENSIIDAVDKGLISKKIHINIHYIGDVSKTSDGTMSFRSLHGDDEWQEDARQLLIKKFYPDKLFAYLKERNKDYTSSNWKDVAYKVGIDTKTIEDNFETVGKKMLEDDFNYTNTLRIATSPTFIVDGNAVVVGLGQLKAFDDYKNLNISNQPNSNAGCGQ